MDSLTELADHYSFPSVSTLNSLTGDKLWPFFTWKPWGKSRVRSLETYFSSIIQAPWDLGFQKYQIGLWKKKKNELIDCSFEKRPFTDVLEIKYSQKFRNIHREAPALESLFNKVASWKASNLFYDTGLSTPHVNIRRSGFLMFPGSIEVANGMEWCQSL